MPNIHTLAAAFLLTAASLTAQAETPWGEKDEADLLREARTYHIMFKSEQDAAAAKARLSAKSDKELFSAFQKLARAESKDPGSAPAGGDLGIVQEGVMVKSFERALFSLAPRTVSDPVKSEFGWHLIYAFDFKNTSVKSICTTSLAGSVERSQGTEREILFVSDSLRGASDFVQRISQIIGPEWGAPMKDWNGDLAFVQLLGEPGQASKRKALVHIEYMTPILSTAPLACRRSVRQEYEIDCSVNLSAPAGRFEYEGRAATGRLLVKHLNSEAERTKFASNTGFHGQLVTIACPRQVVTQAQSPGATPPR
jgi:hypothetical protein